MSPVTSRPPRGTLTARVCETLLPPESPFFVLDVGCSGGIDELWYAFGDRFEAVGFDPLVAEVERLNAATRSPGVRYEAARVTCRDYDTLYPREVRKKRGEWPHVDLFERSSAAAVKRRLQTSYEQTVFNKGAPIVYTDRAITLDDYVPEQDRPRVDFLKIDTDGHDIAVVLGAQALMAAGGMLGVLVEAQLQGSTHEFANTFTNIDRILKRHGFTLFDLTTNRYSRASLPAPFAVDLAAQTTSGQLLWGDALYLRELASRDYERLWPGYEVTKERVLKLACLFDLFDLPDCAAELLINRGGFLEQAQRDALLDLLVSPEPGSYAAHLAAFEADYESFYPSRIQQQAEAERAAAQQTAETVEQAELRKASERVRELEEINTQLLERLKARRKKTTALRHVIEKLETRRK
jgi:FkbM family methyltransferase